MNEEIKQAAPDAAATRGAPVPPDMQTQTDPAAQPSLEAMRAASLGAPREDAPGVVWKDSPANITNKYGEWQQGVPRFDLTPDQIAELGPGFETAPTTRSAKDKH